MMKALKVDNTPDHPLMWIAGLLTSLAAAWLLPEMRPVLSVLAVCFLLGLPLNSYFSFQRGRVAARKARESVQVEILPPVVAFTDAAA